MVQSIFHLLNYTFPGEIFFRLGDVGAPYPHSLRVLAYASRSRAAANLDKLVTNMAHVHGSSTLLARPLTLLQRPTHDSMASLGSSSARSRVTARIKVMQDGMEFKLRHRE